MARAARTPAWTASRCRRLTGQSCGLGRVKAADYAIGDVVDDRFEILDILGQGGFSKVYRVRDDVEDDERALKLFDNAAGDAAVRREIGALRKIRHPNVVEVYWAGKTRAGDWYLITEFIEGEPLSEFTGGRKVLRDREAVDVALDLLDALVAFHPDSERLSQLDAKRRDGELSEAEFNEWRELTDKGLVHRDIKPFNVMLTRTGAKLLDFNIASRVGDEVRTRSGTPPYQPPDANLARWDVSPDLFAVGVVLYQLLCDGHHPYPNKTPMVDEPVIDPEQSVRTSTPSSQSFSSRHAPQPTLTASPRPLRCNSPCTRSALTSNLSETHIGVIGNVPVLTPVQRSKLAYALSSIGLGASGRLVLRASRLGDPRPPADQRVAARSNRADQDRHQRMNHPMTGVAIRGAPA